MNYDPHHFVQITKERVLAEVLHITQGRLASILCIDLADVAVQWASVDGRLCPKIEVNTEAAEGVTRDEINEVITGLINAEILPMMQERMKGLVQRRG